MHSKMFEQIKKWYELGLWSKEQVYNAVPRLITIEEYKEIVGEDYVEGNELAQLQDYDNALNELGVNTNAN